MLQQANDQPKAAVSLEYQAGVLAPDGDFHDRLNFGNTDPVSRERSPVDCDREDRQSLDLLRPYVRSAGNRLEHGFHLSGQPDQRVEIVAKYLDAQIAANAG